MMPTMEEIAYSLVLAAVFASGIGGAWLMDRAAQREERRRPVTPPAPADYGTGVERSRARQARPAEALPRSPQTPVGADAPDTAPTGLRQPAAPTSPHVRRVIVHD